MTPNSVVVVPDSPVLGFVAKIVYWALGGITALAIAAWRLSRIWTRIEDLGVRNSQSLGRLEATIHGSDSRPGLQSQIAQIDTRLDTVEQFIINSQSRRLNSPSRKGGHRKGDSK
jgi:hypothetical protein